jgi:ribosome-binding factor A
MSSRRIAKVAEALRESISTTVLFELKDPRVQNVTVLRIEVSPDLRSARVYVSVMGDEKTQALSMHGLRAARGFIQSRIADRLELRYTPVLSFILDPALKLSAQASTIIREALESAVSSAPAVDAGVIEAEAVGADYDHAAAGEEHGDEDAAERAFGHDEKESV